MITRIARRELRELSRDGRLGWASALMLVLVGAAIVTGQQQARDTARERDEAAALQRQVWVDQPPQNPHGAAHDGLFALKPVRPLAAADRGLDTFAGTVIPMQAHAAQHAAYRPAADRTSLVRFGELTAAMILQVLAPLLVILLGFDLLAGERERGTLRQVLSTGVPRRTWLAGKALALAAAAGAVAVPAALGGLALIVAGDQATRGDTAMRAALLAGAYTIYLAGFAGIALAASAVARSTRAALAGLLAFWILAVVIAPRASADLAAWVAPVPTAGEFARRVTTDLQEGLDGHNPRGEREEAFKQQVLATYGVDDVDALPVNFDALLLQADEEYAADVYARRMAEIWDAYERQAHLQLLPGPFTPVMPIRLISMSLAGTGLAQHRHFADAAEDYRQTFIRTLNHDMAVQSRSGDWNYRAGRDLWEGIEPFAYAPPGWRAAVAASREAWAALAAWCLLGLLAALAGARRVTPV